MLARLDEAGRRIQRRPERVMSTLQLDEVTSRTATAYTGRPHGRLAGLTDERRSSGPNALWRSPGRRRDAVVRTLDPRHAAAGCANAISTAERFVDTDRDTTRGVRQTRRVCRLER